MGLSKASLYLSTIALQKQCRLYTVVRELHQLMEKLQNDAQNAKKRWRLVTSNLEQA
jgi:hypothetical protein